MGNYPDGFSNSKLHVHGWKPKDQLSTWFKFYEMTKSDTADANNIENIPTLEHIRCAQALAETVLDKVRDQFGVTLINSWFRCERLEKVVAGSGYRSWLRRNNLPDSMANWDMYFQRKQHPKAMAADVEVKDPNVSNTDLFNWIRDNCEYDQLILENVKNPNDPRSGWVHVSFDPNGNNRKQAFTI